VLSLRSSRGFTFLIISYLVTSFLLTLGATLLVRSSTEVQAAEQDIRLQGAESVIDVALRTLQTNGPPELAVGACQEHFATVTLEGVTSGARLCLEAEEDLTTELRRLYRLEYRLEATGPLANGQAHAARSQMRVELTRYRVQFPGVITTVGTTPSFLNDMTITGPVASTNSKHPVPLLYFANGDGPSILNGDILFPGGDEWDGPPMIVGSGTWNGEYDEIASWKPPAIRVPPGAIELGELVSPVNILLQPGDYVVENVQLEAGDQLLVTSQGARLYVRDDFVVWGGTVGIEGGGDGTPLLVALVGVEASDDGVKDPQSPGPYLGLKKGSVTALIYAPDRWLDILVDIPGLTFRGGMVIDMAAAHLPFQAPSVLTYDKALKGRWFPLGDWSLTGKTWIMSSSVPAVSTSKD